MNIFSQKYLTNVVELEERFDKPILYPYFYGDYFVLCVISSLIFFCYFWFISFVFILSFHYFVFILNFLGAPTAPTNIKFTERLEGFIVHWDFLRKDISKYEFRLTTEDNKNLDYTLEESKKQKDYILKYEIRNLKRGVIYKFQMRAVDKNNQIGEWSSSVDAVSYTHLTLPTILLV